MKLLFTVISLIFFISCKNVTPITVGGFVDFDYFNISDKIY